MSELRATTISNAAGTGPITMTGQYAAKAWVNFQGTGTVAIRESGNVSSITDSNTGDYTINFTAAMPDVNSSYTATHTSYTGSIGWSFAFITSSSTLRVLTFGNVETSNIDPGTVTATLTR